MYRMQREGMSLSLLKVLEGHVNDIFGTCFLLVGPVSSTSGHKINDYRTQLPVH